MDNAVTAGFGQRYYFEYTMAEGLDGAWNIGERESPRNSTSAVCPAAMRSISSFVRTKVRGKPRR